MNTVLPFLLIPVMLFASVLMHELGHVFAGWLVGARFQEMMVQGITLRRTSKGLKWSFGTWHMGGHALSFLKGIHRYRDRTIAIIVGGPIANLAMIGLGVLGLHLGGESPLIRVWIYANLADIAISFTGDLDNDYQHLRWALGKDEAARSYLAGVVLYAEDVDDATRRAELSALGHESALAFKIYKDRVAEGDSEGARRAVEEALATIADDEPGRRVWYECHAAFQFAYRRIDVARAAAILPPETRAQAYECEATWLSAATMLALAEARWAEARSLAERGVAHENAPEDLVKWFEMAIRLSDRHLKPRSA